MFNIFQKDALEAALQIDISILLLLINRRQHEILKEFIAMNVDTALLNGDSIINKK